MKFSLIVCTYKRPGPLLTLLNSVNKQLLIPNEILIIDGSPDKKTEEIISSIANLTLRYFRVREKDRGLTRQRNFGISKISAGIEIVCFLDDDTVLTPEYFNEIINTYQFHREAVGVGGYILNEVNWRKFENDNVEFDEFEFDGWVRKLGSRNFLRKRFGLLSNEHPGYMPIFSNGLSTAFLPPSGKTYPVEFFMGGVASYRYKVFEDISFSNYFVGYGLYEDMDFCIRASRIGKLYVNTAAQLLHYHEEEGRPLRFEYGKMVLRNGWYVWRVKYPQPGFLAILKWHATAFLLTLVRISNVINTDSKKEALMESLGRICGWWSLLFNPPKHEA